jgi:hypothetical protein
MNDSIAMSRPVRYPVNMPRDVMSGSKKPGDHKQIDKAASTAGIDTSDRVLADLLKR